jgi:hypothetical protein
MTSFPETKAAWIRLQLSWENYKWQLRARICEDAIGFAYWICPKGYCPSPSKLLADVARDNKLKPIDLLNQITPNQAGS